MIAFDQAVAALKQRLLLLENSKPVSTQSELAAVRCHFCGDSDNARHAHLYIGVREYNNKLCVVYDCKKCGRHGFVTPSFLRGLSINDVFIEAYLKSTMVNRRAKVFSGEEGLPEARFLFPKITKEDRGKVNYLSERLQLDFDNKTIQDYKIILNFASFLRLNNIADPAVSRDKIPLISEHGIGFLSEDKKSVSVRNMDPGAAYQDRFNIIRLFQGPRHPFMYIPPCNVDVLTPFPCIAVSESSFNIICVKNYFYPEDGASVIFASSSRKMFSRPVMRLIQLSGFVGGQIDIYADNDDEEFDAGWYREHMSKYLENFDVTVYLNSGGKDFGNMPKPGEKFNYKAVRL
jgi:hypothetical protein